jgi:serine/threonine-protein kinase
VGGEVNGAPPPSFDDRPPPPDYDRRGSRWPWVVLVLIALLIAGGVAAYLLLKPVKVVVPNVVGLKLNDATTIVQNDNLSPSAIDVPSQAPANTVIRQTPQAGTKLTENSTVTLTVSSGPGNDTVPPVSDIPLAQAKKIIQAAGLKVGLVVEQPDNQIRAGNAISSQPGTGQSVPAGTQVELIVSSGKPKSPVPDVTGLASSDAKAQLVAAGFKVKQVNETTSSSPADTVLSENPAANTQEPAGYTVTIVVAQAPTTANVPDVRGQSVASAANALGQAGFNVKQTSQNVTDPNKDGIVLRESPAPNTTQKKGSTVTIVVGHYQQPTTSTSTTTTTTTTPTTG